VSFPEVASSRIMGSIFEIQTVGNTTASLLYDTHQGRVLAGRRVGAIPSLTPGMLHSFDLSVLGRGTWHFEVHLFSGSWRTIADNAGAAWSLSVP